MSVQTRASLLRHFAPAVLTLSALCLPPHAHADAPKPAASAAAGAAAAAAAPAAADGVININTASAEEFNRLPGVGPSRAEAIVTLRTKLKRFEHLEDIMRVKGIGRATFRKLRPILRLEGATTLVAPATHTRAPKHHDAK